MKPKYKNIGDPRNRHPNLVGVQAYQFITHMQGWDLYFNLTSPDYYFGFNQDANWNELESDAVVNFLPLTNKNAKDYPEIIAFCQAHYNLSQ